MKQRIISQVIGTEGGYVNDPLDSGGETKFGITKKRARAWGYMKPMILLDYDTAYQIYSDEDWKWVSGDQLMPISLLICREVFDTCVNCGSWTAGRILQECLNVLSKSQLEVDGKIGTKTNITLSRYTAKRGPNIILECYKARRVVHYMELVAKYPKNRPFIHGWVTRVCKLGRS
jgi:lysozyme family protein